MYVAGDFGGAEPVGPGGTLTGTGTHEGLTRRDVAKRVAVGGGIAWAAPAVLTMSRAAAAGSPAPICRPSVSSMSGLEEVPTPNASPGSGSATFTVNTSTGEVCGTGSVQDLQGAVFTIALHHAPAGIVGPLVMVFFGSASGNTSGNFSGCKTDAALAADICANPADYYLNIHTSAFPAGEIRGQLS